MLPEDMAIKTWDKEYSCSLARVREDKRAVEKIIIAYASFAAIFFSRFSFVSRTTDV